MVRLKDYPDLYVGKRSCTYAFGCRDLREGKRPNKYWFVKEKHANIWSEPKYLKASMTASCRTSGFDKYEVLIYEGGSSARTVVRGDLFYANHTIY
jgi:hypothetical protein